MNTTPSSGEKIRILQFIASREENLLYLNREIEKERSRLTIAEKAVANLTAAVKQTNNLLKSHQGNLASLRSSQERLARPEWTTFTEMQDEPESRELYKSLTGDIGHYLKRNRAAIEEHVTIIQAEISSLFHHHEKIERELVGWKFTRDLAQGSISQSKASIDEVETAIKRARGALSSIHKIPKEIWAYIFIECLWQEYEAYIARDSTTTLRPLPKMLSRVCRSWRDIVLQVSGLWSIIPIHALNSFSVPKYESFCKFLSNTSTGLTVVADLSRGSESNIKYNTPYQSRTDLPAMKDCTLHLLMHGDGHLQKLGSIPFGNPTKLRISILSTGNQSQMPQIYRFFPNISAFELYDEGSRLMSLANMATRLPSVRHLKLNLQYIPRLDLTSHLNRNLLELRIRHNGSSQISRLPSTLCLSHLKILGVTYPEIAFLESLDAPSLHKLELYGTRADQPGSVGDASISGMLSRIRVLSLYDWRPPSPSVGQLEPEIARLWCSSSLFRRIAGFTTSLLEVNFVDCQVNATPLIDLFVSRSEGAESLVPQLQSIRLTGCWGITGAECDNIAGFFQKLHIH